MGSGVKEQFGPMRVRAPIVIKKVSRKVQLQLQLMLTPLPSLYRRAWVAIRGLANILEICTIINLDQAIDVSFILEENKFFFFGASQGRKWRLVVDDTATRHFVGNL